MTDDPRPDEDLRIPRTGSVESGDPRATPSAGSEEAEQATEQLEAGEPATFVDPPAQDVGSATPTPTVPPSQADHAHPAGTAAEPASEGKQSPADPSKVDTAKAKVDDVKATAQAKVGQAKDWLKPDHDSAATPGSGPLAGTPLAGTAAEAPAAKAAEVTARPEVQVGLAFAGGVAAALLLKALGK